MRLQGRDAMRRATRMAAAMAPARVAIVMGASIAIVVGTSVAIVVGAAGIVPQPVHGAGGAIAQVMLEADPGLVSMMMMGHDGHGQHQHADP